MSISNTAILKITELETQRLQLGPEETVGVLLTSRRKIALVDFDVQGQKVSPIRNTKYFGN